MALGVRKLMVGSPTVRRIMRFPGSTGIITTADKFRVEFAGVLMETACRNSSLGVPTKVTSGGLDGIRDLTSGAPGSGVCQFTNGLNQAGVITVTQYSGASCTGTPTNVNSTNIILNATVGSAEHVLLVALTGSGGGFAFFEANIPVCDFIHGGVFNNRITAFGNYNFTYGSFAMAMGRLGTATITRVCP